MRLHQTLLTFALAALVIAGMPVTAQAGAFSVAPVRMYMAPKDRALAVTLSNESDEELVMQADVYIWTQKPGGEDQLTLTEDLILSPPILKLAPRARQVVRLARLVPAPTTVQQTYRLIVRELPEARPGDKKLQLQLALAFSLPVFITPPGARRQLSCALERVSADSVRASCENTGSAYAQPTAFSLLGASGETLALRETGGYILPSVRRSFDLKRASGAIAPGPARLAVTLDDGSVQNFDGTLPP
jgi:fimbrial chaperone protein